MAANKIFTHAQDQYGIIPKLPTTAVGPITTHHVLMLLSGSDRPRLKARYSTSASATLLTYDLDTRRVAQNKPVGFRCVKTPSKCSPRVSHVSNAMAGRSVFKATTWLPSDTASEIKPKPLHATKSPSCKT